MRTVIDADSIKRAIVRIRMIHMLALAFACAAVPACAQTTLALDKISLPPGFKIEVLVRLENPRAMALGSEGTLFAGSMRAGNVYAIK
jgi:hypothetical protein